MYWAVLGYSKERTIYVHKRQKRGKGVTCPRIGKSQGVRRQVEEQEKETPKRHGRVPR